jgi:acetyltransferase
MIQETGDTQTIAARHSLDSFFAPRSIAVIGATERLNSVGLMVIENLLAARFAGPIYPVNPKRETVKGLRCYSSVDSLPEVDLAVVVTPADTVPGVIEDCGQHGIRAALVISAGFKETGVKGAELEARVLEAARSTGVRIVGPNCLGIISPYARLNASFAASMALPGNVAFLSQSGALCTAVLDWSLREHVGFSAFVSAGSMLDISWGDLIRHFGEDPKTACLLIYMESVGNARAFLSAARETALNKPIIVLKAGRSEAAAKATVSHTGSLAGSDEVFDAAFARCGALRVNTIAELFYMAECLSKQPRPVGRRLTIVTNAGGPAVLATDALIAPGGQLASIPAATVDALGGFLPPHWSRGNPIDLLGDASPETFGRAIFIAARNPESDGLLVVLSPQGMTDPTAVARQLIKNRPEGKPLLASWMGASSVAEGEALLNNSGIPTFPYPDTAARAFTLMWRYSHNIDALYETPTLVPDHANPLEDIETFLRDIGAAGRTLLTEVESKKLLAAYGIPCVPTWVAKTEEAAVVIAEDVGYPVVVKLHSESITHKTDVDGVRLNLRDAKDVRTAFRSIQESVSQRVGVLHFQGVSVQQMRRGDYELIVGSHVDSQFGPVVVFGAGGQYVEVFRDRAIGLPPLNTTLARRLIEQTRISMVLDGFRGRPPVNRDALEQLLVRFSSLVAEQRMIQEIDINPVLATGNELVVLDARIVLYPRNTPASDLPRLAIRPYPAQYQGIWFGRNAREFHIRPIRAEDEPAIVSLHRNLSEQSVHQRYFSALSLDFRTAHSRLTRVCCVDYDRELALVAEIANSKEIVGVARFIREGQTDAEFAIVVRDEFQNSGLGSELLGRLLDAARAEGIGRIHSFVLRENVGMLRLCRKLGFQLRDDIDPDLVVAELELQ